MLHPHLYGTIMAFGVLVSFLIAQKRAKKFKIAAQEVESLYLLLIPVCVLGARLYHVLHWWHYYAQNPPEILALWQGGLGVYGAITAGIIGLFIFAKIKRLSIWTLLDFLFPQAALIQVIGRFANFFNQEAFGPPTNLPWKIYIASGNRPLFWQQDSYFHPLFLYESLFMLLGFFVLLALSQKYPQQRGLVTGAYLILYGSIRFLTEFGRFDTWQISGVKVAQVLSILSVLIGTSIVLRPKRLGFRV
jgi:phosphatidylglycerol:prolipoprotein diacylglycerol transferase